MLEAEHYPLFSSTSSLFAMSRQSNRAAGRKRAAQEDANFPRSQPTKISKSAQLLSTRQEPKSLRRRGAVPHDQIGTQDIASSGAPATTLPPTTEHPLRLSDITSIPAASRNNQTHSYSHQTSNNNVEPPVLSDLPAPAPEGLDTVVFSELPPGMAIRYCSGENGLEMYGYTDEEPMRDDPDGEHTELSPGPEDDPNDSEDSTYQEDPSLALVAPAPTPHMPPTRQATPPPEAPQELPKKPKGKRKGKKIVVEEPEEIAIEEPEGP
jgi:hypothetical protein